MEFFLWRVEFFKIAKCDFTFMREMRVHVWQGRNWLPKTGRANSNVAHRRCPAAPSILPKSGWVGGWVGGYVPVWCFFNLFWSETCRWRRNSSSILDSVEKAAEFNYLYNWPTNTFGQYYMILNSNICFLNCKFLTFSSFMLVFLSFEQTIEYLKMLVCSLS